MAKENNSTAAAELETNEAAMLGEVQRATNKFQQFAEPVRTQLQDLARKFKITIFHQENLIDLAKPAASNESEIEALVISIDRFNDDLFELAEELQEIADAGAKGGQAMSAQKLAELTAAASKAGADCASDWEPDNGIRMEDYRLRCLMNFENSKGLVLSTSDAEAIPQWRAFLEGFDKKAGGNCVSMNEQRGSRFRDAVCEAMEANDSLACIARKFDLYDMTTDDVQPKLVVDGMTAAIGKRLNLLFAMMNNQEEPREQSYD